MASVDVLIAGAGPTGLVLALWLTKLGVRVRIIDRTTDAGTTSRALAVQARTLELYRQLDLADEIVRRGHKVPAVNLWARGHLAAHLSFETIGADLTPFSFLEIFPQDEHERLLIGRLEQLGVPVERQVTLQSFADHGTGVTAALQHADGSKESVDAAYLAGCDGARSVVRETLGIGFPGGTYREIFYVADIEGAGPAIDGALHVDLDASDFLAVFPLTDPGHARLIGSVRGDRADRADTLTFADVSGQAIAHLKVEVRKVNWFSTYHVHHRVAEHFGRGRAFLLGDAAHIHSPVGGQGMNTGIGDAINLAWKLAWVLHGKANTTLLDSYEIERIEFARKLVATTDRAFSLVTAEGWVAEVVRTRIAPVAISTAVGFDPFREYLFRTVSQIMLNYRGMPLSAGSAGSVHGGDRLPWVAGGVDNHAPLSAMVWQLHIYGEGNDQAAAWCEERGIGFHRFAWTAACREAGLVQDAMYLMRPDSYVALVDGGGDLAVIDRYFAERGIRG